MSNDNFTNILDDFWNEIIENLDKEKKEVTIQRLLDLYRLRCAWEWDVYIGTTPDRTIPWNNTPASAESASPALSQGLTANKERGQGNA